MGITGNRWEHGGNNPGVPYSYANMINCHLEMLSTNPGQGRNTDPKALVRPTFPCCTQVDQFSKHAIPFYTSRHRPHPFPFLAYLENPILLARFSSSSTPLKPPSLSTYPPGHPFELLSVAEGFCDLPPHAALWAP